MQLQGVFFPFSPGNTEQPVWCLHNMESPSENVERCTNSESRYKAIGEKYREAAHAQQSQAGLKVEERRREH